MLQALAPARAFCAVSAVAEAEAEAEAEADAEAPTGWPTLPLAVA